MKRVLEQKERKNDGLMVGRFKVIQTEIAGLVILERIVMEDKRGAFSRLFDAEEFRNAGMANQILQINHSITRIKGTARGLHYQHPPYAELKVVTCLKGTVYDVAVDLRHGSRTFLSWHGEFLSETNKKSIIIPRGFAHGFQTMTNDSEFLYLHDACYAPEAEGGFHIEDKRIGIKWPLPISMVSERDMKLPTIKDGYEGIKT